MTIASGLDHLDVSCESPALRDCAGRCSLYLGTRLNRHTVDICLDFGHPLLVPQLGVCKCDDFGGHLSFSYALRFNLTSFVITKLLKCAANTLFE